MSLDVNGGSKSLYFGTGIDTTGILAGQFNAMRVNAVEMLELANRTWIYLPEIAKNTAYEHLERHLISIDNRLSSTGSAFDFERSQK